MDNSNNPSDGKIRVMSFSNSGEVIVEVYDKDDPILLEMDLSIGLDDDMGPSDINDFDLDLDQKIDENPTAEELGIYDDYPADPPIDLLD